MDDNNNNSDDDEYTIPLQDQRVFGAGLKRKRVHFVPSSTPTDSIPTSPKASSHSRSVADLYLSLVMPKSPETRPVASTSNVELSQISSKDICEVCHLPKSEIDGDEEAPCSVKKAVKPHEASFAHQVCLPHSHPPSHIDRHRKGLAILSSYGYDPDARLGLGSQGQGIRFPIKAKSKKHAHDKMGLGLVVPKEVLNDTRTKAEWKKETQKLDAKKVRKMEESGRRDRVKMQELFYGNGDVERYLGTG